MEHDYLYKKFIEWMITFVETSNPNLNDWPPCPFAKQARLSNKIYFKVIDTHMIESAIDSCLINLKNFEVVVLAFDHTQINGDQVQDLVLNKNIELMKQNYVILEDHPEIEEYINGVCMNFKECGLLIIQELSKLNDASKNLFNKGYYKVWSKDNIDEVVRWRNTVE